MYKINRESNEIQKIKQCSFTELGFRERDHLQEWIAKEPSVLGEELLIIQKEFSGFSDTQERLDLLALDKYGSLVIIENKLDDSGRDVTWQALKYASYCSSLSKENIRKIYQDYLDQHYPNTKAEDNLSDFFDGAEYDDIALNKGITQRIILIAAKYRKEVTSTVLWLMNFKIRLQCFRATPNSVGDDLFLNVEQIIPTQDAEEYMIGMAEKVQDDISSQNVQNQLQIIRKEFWGNLINEMNKKSTLYKNINAGLYHWIGAGSGVRGLGLNFAVTKSYGRAELYIDRGNKDENKFIFDELIKHKEQIEKDYGDELVWERLDTKRASRIKAEVPGDVTDKEQWHNMIEFMTVSMNKLDLALRDSIKSVGDKLKNYSHDELD